MKKYVIVCEAIFIDIILGKKYCSDVMSDLKMSKIAQIVTSKALLQGSSVNFTNGLLPRAKSFSNVSYEKFHEIISKTHQNVPHKPPKSPVYVLH